MNFDQNGRSKGTAEVILARRQDAVQAIKTYNGVKLDGRPLRIELVGGAPGGVTLSSGVTVTGVRGGAFSVSVDERDTEAPLAGALANAFEALFGGGKAIGLTLRSLLEEQATFDGALAALSGAGAVHLIAPVYVILGGARPGEGAVVTRDRNADSHLWRLGDRHAAAPTNATKAT